MQGDIRNRASHFYTKYNTPNYTCSHRSILNIDGTVFATLEVSGTASGDIIDMASVKLYNDKKQLMM